MLRTLAWKDESDLGRTHRFGRASVSPCARAALRMGLIDCSLTLSPRGRGNYSVLITSRPAYWPQLGQIECGRLGFLQLGQGWSWTRASARCERRRPFLDFDCLTFGSAMPAEFYRNREYRLSSGLRSDLQPGPLPWHSTAWLRRLVSPLPS